ncbi:hypothetical protein B0T24DRAFT_352657 [Lasiosphaeria ovina]|uniref:SH3 domain-containing protein n=1 Tax=Lasiosphaeria ovina TaxID=92902 RepID=A0AAE0N3P6_9PEZI|nr:hypothetical protein B0T24DRAFT_352657 [Lasiosphaeria ovina]
MDEEVQDLVLGPFRDVVDKAKTALEIAKESDDLPMQKAAQTLVNNGERALKKIEPVCKRQLDEYSSNFVDALKENDEISGVRKQLHNLECDLDDSIDAGSFEPDFFSKVQAVLRTVAFKTAEVVVRMKLEHPHVEPELSVVSGMSRAPSASDTQQLAEQEALGQPDAPPPDESAQLRSVMQSRAGPIQPWEDDRATTTTATTVTPAAEVQRSAESVSPEEIPPEPPVNPWQPTEPLPLRLPEVKPEVVPERRPRLEGDSDVVSPMTPSSDVVSGLATRHRRLDQGVEQMIREEAERWKQGASTRDLANPWAGDTVSPISSDLPSVGSGRAPQVVTEYQRLLSSQANATKFTLPSQRDSRASSLQDSIHPPSIFDNRGGTRDSLMTTSSPVSDPRNSYPPNPDQSTAPSVSSRDSFHSLGEPSPNPHAQPSPTGASWSSLMTQPAPPYQPRLPPVPQESSIAAEQPGLIPVISEEEVASPTRPREADCTIGLDSSFYQLKGFCEGAKDVLRGNPGVRKIKRPSGIHGTVIVAKCDSCMFEQDWNSVDRDRTRKEEAFHTLGGVSFRLRFLSKSHLPVRRVDEQLYGCLFCVHAGRTMEESDATVFLSQKQLFDHLARHPRPLPVIPGLVVIGGASEEVVQAVPLEHRGNNDLHFTAPPVRSVMTGIAQEVGMLPAAIATAEVRPMHGSMRSAPDRQPVHRFMPGARIVGIEFPTRYKGEWGVGWADNIRAALPMDSVRLLRPPDRAEVRVQSTSNFTAVARWKRAPKDKDGGAASAREGTVREWLKFDKGETITSIAFPSKDHWCWSGCNSKGKWGIFPKEFMDPDSLRETPAAGDDRASNWSHEERRGNVFSRITTSRRKMAAAVMGGGGGGGGSSVVGGSVVGDRPTSSAESYSSGDTAKQRSPRPSFY